MGIDFNLAVLVITICGATGVALVTGFHKFFPKEKK